MKKFFLIAGIMLAIAGCNIIMPASGQEDDKPGQDEPVPEPKPHEDTPDEAIQKVRLFGAYGVEGEDYVYQKGQWQLSRKYSENGRYVTFSMLDEENSLSYAFNNILTDPGKGKSFTVSFVITGSDGLVKNVTSSVKMLKSSGDTLWLKSSRGAYYIVKK